MLLVLSCSNTKANAAQDAAAAVEGVDVMEVDSLTLVAINDNEGEKRMPNKLFYGEADSAKSSVFRRKGRYRRRSAASSSKRRARTSCLIRATGWSAADGCSTA